MTASSTWYPLDKISLFDVFCLNVLVFGISRVNDFIFFVRLMFFLFCFKFSSPSLSISPSMFRVFIPCCANVSHHTLQCCPDYLRSLCARHLFPTGFKLTFLFVIFLVFIGFPVYWLSVRSVLTCVFFILY